MRKIYKKKMNKSNSKKSKNSSVNNHKFDDEEESIFPSNENFNSNLHLSHGAPTHSQSFSGRSQLLQKNFDELEKKMVCQSEPKPKVNGNFWRTRKKNSSIFEKYSTIKEDEESNPAYIWEDSNERGIEKYLTGGLRILIRESKKETVINKKTLFCEAEEKKINLMDMIKKKKKL
jgi:hypothetical protein